MAAERLTAIDLFSGAGGFSLAAAGASVDVRAAIEINRHACETYTRNFIEGKKNPPALFESDIRLIKWDEVLCRASLTRGQCDILLGGPPCQGFSTHRIKDAGVDDPRNDLLLRYFDAVEAIWPKTFVVENVSGILWRRHAKFLDRFLELVTAAGYTLHGPTILNARDFGVPQNRKRVFFVGIRSDIAGTLEWPPPQTHFSTTSSEVIVDGRPAWNIAKQAFSAIVAGDVNAIHMNHSEKLLLVFQSTPKNGGSRYQSSRVLPCHKTHDGHKDVYGRIDPSKPGPTMTTACINPSKGRFLHPTADHGISARHAARIQDFPDEFVFEGGLITVGEQIGNAVPIGLGKAVIVPITKLLRNSPEPAVRRHKSADTKRAVPMIKQLFSTSRRIKTS